jgi:hypothetical protein
MAERPGSVIPPTLGDEQLWPGDTVIIVYDMVSTNLLWAYGWADAILNRLMENPFYRIYGYEMDWEAQQIVFRVQIRPYVSELDTGKVVPVVNGRPVAPQATPVQEAGLTPLDIGAAILLAGLAIAGFAWLTEREKRLAKSEERKLIEARQGVLRDPQLSPQQKAEMLEVPEPESLTAVVSGSLGTAAGFVVAVVLVVWLYRVFTNGRNARSESRRWV